ncbi:hypothetical protein [Achromobacter phage maay_LB1]|nr:hypothetical protein [Achromobacter phage hasilly_LB3]WNO48782.1 hypothetical protein [Achromobacter phage nyaak_TL1]WNO48845.1 hypothetical protein [Achromobacter phage maay_LB1]WNO48975.1 hypothetical protein [Achromobacter phage ewii_LB8]WNO49331.1 hypothetical protein [Achromobacter phage kwar_LB4]WOZ53390.1 hypothetical protein [Achromobacter phage tuull]
MSKNFCRKFGLKVSTGYKLSSLEKPLLSFSLAYSPIV